MTFHQTEEMMRRLDAMNKQGVTTRICSSLDIAMTVADEDVKKAAHITLWPLKESRWLVAAWVPLKVS